jgi:predicted ABC-type ATPase
LADTKPRMTVFAGTNGAGKSTITRHLTEGLGVIIDLDRMVREQRSDYFTVGKEVIKSVEQYIQTNTSFSIETTLSSKIIFHQMEMAKASGFEIHAYYVGLHDVDLHILRVQERVKRGGHFISEEDIRRRYDRSLKNLPKLIELADKVSVIDNTVTPVHLIQFEVGRQVSKLEHLPDWATLHLRRFFN